MDEDRDYARAWQEEEVSRCSECGFPRDEAYDPDSQGWYSAEPVTCHACAAREEMAARKHDEGTTYGMRFAVVRDRE